LESRRRRCVLIGVGRGATGGEDGRVLGVGSELRLTAVLVHAEQLEVWRQICNLEAEAERLYTVSKYIRQFATTEQRELGNFFRRVSYKHPFPKDFANL